MNANEYCCEYCGGTFEKGWDDADALAEQKANGWENKDCAVICDDCYREIMDWHGGVHPTIAQALAAFAPPPWMVKPSLVVPCPACDGGWRDTDRGTVMCGQCRGSGRVATSGGEA